MAPETLLGTPNGVGGGSLGGTEVRAAVNLLEPVGLEGTATVTSQKSAEYMVTQRHTVTW